METKNIADSASNTNISSKESLIYLLVDVLWIEKDTLSEKKVDTFHSFLNTIDTEFQNSGSDLRLQEAKKDAEIKKISKKPQDFVLKDTRIPSQLPGYKYPTMTFWAAQIPLNPYMMISLFDEAVSVEDFSIILSKEWKQLRKADLWRIGCNLAADPGIIIERSKLSLTSKTDTTPKIALIIRKDTGRIANPGWMVDSVELGRSWKTAKREAIEEIFWKYSGINFLKMKMKTLSEGYTSDHRNGLFSWIETSLNYGVAPGVLNFSKMKVNPLEVENVLLLTEDDVSGKNDFIIIKDAQGKIKDAKRKKEKNNVTFSHSWISYWFHIENDSIRLSRINGKYVKVWTLLNTLSWKKIPKIRIEWSSIFIGDDQFDILDRPLERNDFHWEEEWGSGHFDQIQKIFTEYNVSKVERTEQDTKWKVQDII